MEARPHGLLTQLSARLWSRDIADQEPPSRLHTSCFHFCMSCRAATRTLQEAPELSGAYLQLPRGRERLLGSLSPTELMRNEAGGNGERAAEHSASAELVGVISSRRAPDSEAGIRLNIHQLGTGLMEGCHLGCPREQGLVGEPTEQIIWSLCQQRGGLRGGVCCETEEASSGF